MPWLLDLLQADWHCPVHLLAALLALPPAALVLTDAPASVLSVRLPSTPLQVAPGCALDAPIMDIIS